MRFISLVKVNETAFAKAPPAPELFDAIGKLADEMLKAGVMLDMGGLLPSGTGARLRLKGGKITVTDGPFAEVKEVIGGYAVYQAKSKAEAVEHGRRFLQLHADILGDRFECEVELRQFDDSNGAPPSLLTPDP